MSGYTVGEITVWLVLAAVVGFALGWLLSELRCRASHSARPVADPAALRVVTESPPPAKKSAAKKTAVRTAPAKTASTRSDPSRTTPPEPPESS